MNAQPATSFEWPIYADATLAGLSVLIPVPFVDDTSEGFFRKRMLRRIARARGHALSEDVEAELSEEVTGSWAAVPIKLTLGLLKRLSRKVLYFLTVKTATDRLSYYWHRAYLLDHMLAAGHLDGVESARTARHAMDQVLAGTTGPLRQVASQLITRTRNVGQLLRRARAGDEDDVMEQVKGPLEQEWGAVAGYLESVAARYDEAYGQLRTARPTTR